MTQTDSRPRIRAANTIAVRQRPRRWRVVATALLALGLFAGPGAMAQATGDAVEFSRVDAAAQPATTPRVTLAPFSHGIVTTGAALSISVVVENLTARGLLATTASLDLGRTPITDRAALEAWQNGVVDPNFGPFVRGGDVAIDAVPAGEVATAGISIDGAAPEITGLAPGVYPLIVRYGTGENAPTSTSTMIVRDPAAEARPFDIGVVVPITARPLSTGLLSSAELTKLTAQDGALTALLDAVTGTPAILAVDPAILAAIRVLGTAAPADALAWIQRLDALPNERFSTAFGDGDLATSFDAGLPTPFGPTTLQAYMKPADFMPASATTPSMVPELPSDAPAPGAANVAGEASTPRVAAIEPSATPTPTAPPVDPDVPVFPDFATLLAVNGAHPGMTWPASGTATTALIARLAEVSADAPGATLVASGNTARGERARTTSTRGTVEAAPVLVYDSAISDALRDAASVRTLQLRGAPLAAAAAQLTLAAGQAEGPLLVTVDRSTNRTQNNVSAAIAAVFEVPGATPRGLGDLLAAPATNVDIADAAASESRTEAAHRMTATETKIAEFATVLDDPALLTTPERASIAQLLGAQWRSTEWPVDDEDASEAAWTTAVADHEEQSQRTLSSVGILPPSTTNLLSSDAKLQFWVRNDLPYPVNVIFITSPNDLRLEVSRSKAVTALPNSNTRVEVPVIAKVGSGDVSLQLELRSPTLQPIGDPVTAEVNVRADWELIGIISLAVIVGTLFVAGIVRTVIGRRRRRADASGSGLGLESESGSKSESGSGDGNG